MPRPSTGYVHGAPDVVILIVARPHCRLEEAAMAVSADLAKLLDKEWEDKSLEEILKAPVSALAGVSDGDADALKQAFNVKSVGDLGKNKYFRAAQAMTLLGEAAK
jgi:hypothetical protein